MSPLLHVVKFVNMFISVSLLSRCMIILLIGLQPEIRLVYFDVVNPQNTGGVLMIDMGSVVGNMFAPIGAFLGLAVKIIVCGGLCASIRRAGLFLHFVII